MQNWFKGLNNTLWRFRNSIIVFAHDVCMIPVSWLFAYWLRYNLDTIPTLMWQQALAALPVVVVIQLGFYQVFGLYRGVWRFASMPDLVRIFKAVLAAMVGIVIGLFFYNRLHGTPRSVILMYGLLQIMLLGGSRFVFRWFKDYVGIAPGKRVLIVGAGTAGESLVRDLRRHNQSEYRPLFFLDDDPNKIGKEIHGIRVVASSDQLPQWVEKHNIDLVMIAMPSAHAAEMRRIVDYCEAAKVSCSTLPSLSDLANGRVSVEALRQVSLEDLLGRDPVQLDWNKIETSLHNKTVLVTGGAGSIGSELCRQVARLKPALLLVLDHSEFNLYQIERELAQSFPELRFEKVLLSVNDRIGVEKIFKQHQIDMVFHAAAYKHVPMLEHQARAAVMNNIIGTLTVAQCAVANNVQKFVLISTDKAVHPANIMGASKRAAEIFCQNFGEPANTQFITVRFGNVLGSAGSVVPLFKQQIAAGGPVTVTHPDIQRYFMTIPEATQLILQAMVIGQGGEIFVLDMGEPVKICYLAEQMIRMAGLQPDKDIAIEYVGLRPGEKLFEELFHQNEALKQTTHQKILRATYRDRDWSELQTLLHQLHEACAQADEAAIVEHIRALVPDYVAPKIAATV